MLIAITVIVINIWSKIMKLIKKGMWNQKNLFLVILAIIMGVYMLAKVDAEEVKPVECVFLVHGLGRTRHSMGIMKRRLKREGYKVVSFGYDSRKLTIDEAVAELQQAVSNEVSGVDAPARINFVSHSLGGILIRKLMEIDRPRQLGRVVMLSPPNKGSELPDKLGKIKLYQKVTGPAGLELGTAEDSYPNKLGRVNFPLGVITGDRSFNLLYSKCIPGKDDGKVSVSSAKVDGMADFLVVHSTHTWIMNRKMVFKQVFAFLRNGKFNSEDDS
jgi:hypothetical protein